jgi:hypothetical protein
MTIVKERTWVDRAACKGMGAAMFFPELGEDTRPAKEVCQGCPVKAECYAYSLAISTHHGVWGGKSERERRGNRPEYRPVQQPILHETEKGYVAHVRRGIPPCDGCKWAHADYVRRGKYRRMNMGAGR